MKHFATGINIVVGLVNLVCLFFWTFSFPVPVRMLLGESVYDPNFEDALQAAMSLGRLDSISVLLTILGVMLGLMALASFGYFKYRAETVANDVARQTIAGWQRTQRSNGEEGTIQLATFDPGAVDVTDVDEEDERGDVQ